MRQSFRSDHGYTLIETLIATAISALIIGGAIGAIHQFGTLSRLQQDALTSSQQLQHAGLMLNRDIVGATSGVITDSGDLVLNRRSFPFGRGLESTTTTITYTLSAGNLIRRDESSAAIIARHLEAIDYGPAGPIGTTLHITMTVRLRDQRRTLTLTCQRRIADEED